MIRLPSPTRMHAFITPCNLQLGLSEFASLRTRYEPAPVWEDSAAMRLRRDLDRENEAIPGESEVERVLRNLEADVAVADAKVRWGQGVQPPVASSACHHIASAVHLRAVPPYHPGRMSACAVTGAGWRPTARP